MEATMLFLPKAPPLFENLDASKPRLPDVLNKLGSTQFTGYVHFTFPSSVAILVFQSGKLYVTFVEKDNGAHLSGLDGLIHLATQMFSCDTGVVSAYKLSEALSTFVRAFLRGKPVFLDKELEYLNIHDALERIKNDHITGCLRVYADNRTALIFYRDGKPLGFFHEGSHDMETTSTESQRIASLPGVKIDLVSTQGVEELPEMDLIELVNIQKLWIYTVAQNQSQMSQN